MQAYHKWKVVPFHMIDVPSQTFVDPMPTGGTNRWGNAVAAELLIRTVAEACDISLMQLGSLVGLSFPNHVYNWCSGERRPSWRYLSRIFWLALLELKHPRQVCWMRDINWTTGHIFWKDGYLPPEDIWDRSQLPEHRRLG